MSEETKANPNFELAPPQRTIAEEIAHQAKVEAIQAVAEAHAKKVLPPLES